MREKNGAPLEDAFLTFFCRYYISRNHKR